MLFTIDRRPFEVALARAKAELEQAKAEAGNATLREQRYDKLNSGPISIELVEQVRTMTTTSRTKVTAAEAAIRKPISIWNSAILPRPSPAGPAGSCWIRAILCRPT